MKNRSFRTALEVLSFRFCDTHLHGTVVFYANSLCVGPFSIEVQNAIGNTEDGGTPPSSK